ncbi:nucleotidyltransferase family protein [Geminicoccus harenae]|uniref:hypothetical protein n=1 Tax=Geminicoccus harenae TaxID=2498453 RepID=UPI00168A5632|nr:hypothetical protein [Geminicoccus harenae]
MSLPPANLTTPPKRKHFPIRPGAAWLDHLLQSCLVILAINWVFQGMRGMQAKELAFRIGLGALLALATALPLGLADLPAPLAAIAGILVGHSVNFLLNGQFWVCARYCRAYRGQALHIERATWDLAREIARLPWLTEAAFIGSRARGGRANDRSDIDLRLVFPPGLLGWWRTNWLLLRLRSRALVQGVPLDLYAYDRPDALHRFDQDEPLLVVKDELGRLHRAFPGRAAWFGQLAGTAMEGRVA